MDWTQTLTIIGSLAGFFIYSITRMDSKLGKVENKIEAAKFDIKSDMKDLKDDLRNEMNQRFSEINQRFSDMNQRMSDMNQKLISIDSENKDIGKRLSTIEGALMPRKVYHFEEPSKHDEEPKEN